MAGCHVCTGLVFVALAALMTSAVHSSELDCFSPGHVLTGPADHLPITVLVELLMCDPSSSSGCEKELTFKFVGYNLDLKRCTSFGCEIEGRSIYSGIVSGMSHRTVKLRFDRQAVSAYIQKSGSFKDLHRSGSDLLGDPIAVQVIASEANMFKITVMDPSFVYKSTEPLKPPPPPRPPPTAPPPVPVTPVKQPQPTPTPPTQKTPEPVTPSGEPIVILFEKF